MKVTIFILLELNSDGTIKLLHGEAYLNKDKANQRAIELISYNKDSSYEVIQINLIG